MARKTKLAFAALFTSALVATGVAAPVATANAASYANVVGGGGWCC